MENLINFDQMTIIDPEQRIKELAKIGNMVVVDQNIALSKFVPFPQDYDSFLDCQTLIIFLDITGLVKRW